MEQVSADKAYDSFDCRKAILAKGARPGIRPRKGAAIMPPREINRPPPIRGKIVERIIGIGSRTRKLEAAYHRRSLAETAICRTRSLITPGLGHAPCQTGKPKPQSP